MSPILIQAYDQDMNLVHQALVSSACTQDQIVAYLDAKLGADNWAVYTAPELEAAQ